jgi:cystathionine beta-lyase
MKFDFDKIINRRGTNCYKYDEMPNDDTIALWVADMDFETAPCITEALRRRMEHGCFGYTMVPDSFYQATINWFADRHGWQGIKKEWFIYTSGVVPAISAIIKAVTEPGDKVLVQTPVYNCFYSSIRNNGCTIEEAPLHHATSTQGNGKTDYATNHYYFIDYDEFEAKCADPKVKAFLLCNPHNPAGRVWSADELRKMGEICQRHGVFVIADEIHCEFVNANATRDGYLASYIKEDTPKYHPFMAVSDAPCAVCVSPSKAFNIAGLQIANIIIKDDSTRRKVNRAININEVCDVNPFGVIALEAAYSAEGAEWLDALTHYIYANYDFAKAFIEQHLPQWKVTTLEGTYLMWVKVDTDADALFSRLLEKANVYVNSGTMYDHSAEGHHFIRINLATQRKRLEEGLKRIMENVKGER